MHDLTQARENMVESQIRPSDVTDVRITRAMRMLPRELFLPKTLRSLAYSEEPLEVAPDRIALEPRTLAKLLHEAEIKSNDLVLVVGGASGYTAAIASTMAAAVVLLEDDKALTETASANFTHLDIDTVATVTGTLNEGHPAQAPYDVIIIDGGVEEVPAALAEQLADDGRLVTVVMEGRAGKARLYERTGESVSSRYLFDAAAEILPGFSKRLKFAL